MSETLTRQIERQQRAELDMTSVGIANWRAAERRKDAAAAQRGERTLAEESAGKKLMRAVMPPLIAAVSRYQGEALEALTNPKAGRPFLWYIPVLSLSPEKIAFITLKTVLSQREGWIQASALQIANRIKTEREFEMLAEAERQRVKDGVVSAYEAEQGYESPRSVLDLMKAYARNIDARTVKKWAKKVDHVDKLNWTPEEELSLGCLCLMLLVEAAPEWFEEVEYIKRSRGRMTTQFNIVLTAKAKEFIAHSRGLDELAHPWLIPMIAPPAPWKRERRTDHAVCSAPYHPRPDYRGGSRR